MCNDVVELDTRSGRNTQPYAHTVTVWHVLAFLFCAGSPESELDYSHDLTDSSQCVGCPTVWVGFFTGSDRYFISCWAQGLSCWAILHARLSIYVYIYIYIYIYIFPRPFGDSEAIKPFRDMPPTWNWNRGSYKRMFSGTSRFQSTSHVVPMILSGTFLLKH